MTNDIHICIAADKNYKLPLRCLIYTIYKNSSSHPCTVHVLFDGLSKRYRNSLIKQYNKTNLSIDFKDMSDYNFDFRDIDMEYWTKAIFYRIMIPEIFKDIDRIMYIDGDTLVLQDLYDFFNIEFPEDKSVAMVVDRFSWKRCSLALNIPNYFNSGMILFDLKKCRQDDFSYRCIQWLHDNQKIAKLPDQDAINAVHHAKILRVSNLYNKQCAPGDIILPDNKPFVIHFLSAIKPWSYKSPMHHSYVYICNVPFHMHFLYTWLKHFLYVFYKFCFHKTFSMPVQKNKILEQYKYYIFNICVYTKTINNPRPDLITTLKQMKEKC